MELVGHGERWIEVEKSSEGGDSDEDDVGEVEDEGTNQRLRDRLKRFRGKMLQVLLGREVIDLCKLRADAGESYDTTNPLAFPRDHQRQLQQDLVESASALLCLSDRLRVLHLQGIEIDDVRAHALRAGLQERLKTELYIGFNSMKHEQATHLALALCLVLFKGAYDLSRLRLRLFTSRVSTGRALIGLLVSYRPLARIRVGG